MTKRILVLLLAMALSYCCNKKSCPGDELPRIVVKIQGMVQNSETAILYKLESEKKDSTFIQIDNINPSFYFFPVNDFDDADAAARQFVIRHGNKRDTIDHILVNFKDEEMVCDSRWGCGRGTGKNKTTIKKLGHFSFLYHGKSYGINDTLFLD